MDFGAALQELKCGNKMRRTGWKGVDQWLELDNFDFYKCWHGLTKDILIRTWWGLQQADILAEDWEKVDLAELRSYHVATESRRVGREKLRQDINEVVKISARISKALDDGVF